MGGVGIRQEPCLHLEFDVSGRDSHRDPEVLVPLQAQNHDQRVGLTTTQYRKNQLQQQAACLYYC